MKKGSRKLKNCSHIDFSTLVPDNPQPPICKLGHGWSGACIQKNNCPDYQPAWGRTWEAIKEELGI
jgi:hypothetical protein